MSNDAEESEERPEWFNELAGMLEEINLECQEGSQDGIEEPSPKRRRSSTTFSDEKKAVQSVAKKPACHFEEDCNHTEDTYWLLHFFQRGPS